MKEAFGITATQYGKSSARRAMVEATLANGDPVNLISMADDGALHYCQIIPGPWGYVPSWDRKAEAA